MSADSENRVQAPVPSEKLKALEKLIGSWRISGGADGTVTYHWMEGGFFLMQDVDLRQNGLHIIGIEIIGLLRPFGEPESDAIMSRFYDNQGNTLDYEYEIFGDELTIWAGAKGSPAYFKGAFSPDGRVNHGSWVYPGGYGYESTMTRIDGPKERK